MNVNKFFDTYKCPVYLFLLETPRAYVKALFYQATPVGKIAKRNSLQECTSALKIQCHVVKNILLQFSAILLTG